MLKQLTESFNRFFLKNFSRESFQEEMGSTNSNDTFESAKTHFSSLSLSSASIKDSLDGRVTVFDLSKPGSRQNEESSEDKVDHLEPRSKEFLTTDETSIEDLRNFIKGRKFLIVDDNRLNLMMLQAILKKSGVVVKTAKSGNEAENLAQVNNFDAIIMDYHMEPAMNGDVAIKLIRQLPGYDKTPIIGFSSDENSQVKSDFLEAGANDVMVKPCPEKDLLKKIREITLKNMS